MIKKYNLLVIYIILLSFNCKGEDTHSIFSKINQSSNSENSLEILPNTYEEPNEEIGEENLMEQKGHISAPKFRENIIDSPIEKTTKALEDDKFKSATIYQNTKSAKITALNKITAKSQAMVIKIGEASFFGNIEIKIHKCLKSTDLYKPDNKILLSITENKVDEDQLLLYQGWMISSDIAVGTFEHAVYEVFAEECI